MSSEDATAAAAPPSASSSASTAIPSQDNCYFRSSTAASFECQPRPFTPRFRQAIGFLPLAWRMYKQVRQSRAMNRVPYMDPFHQLPLSPSRGGVPLGGIGAGTIGRGLTGAFDRWQVSQPGVYQSTEVKADAFVVSVARIHPTTGERFHLVQKILSGRPTHWDPERTTHSPANTTYHALYPRSWTTYTIDECGILLRLVCRQVSPVIADDYRDSSLPCAVFVWEVTVVSDEQGTRDGSTLAVSVCFSWQNGTGENADVHGGHVNRASGEHTVVLEHRDGAYPVDFAIAAEGETVGRCVGFVSEGGDGSSARAVWRTLRDTGSVAPSPMQQQHSESATTTMTSRVGEAMSAALSVTRTGLSQGSGGERLEVGRFALSWYAPEVRFNDSEREYTRRYARYVSSAAEAAEYALERAVEWEERIFAWQRVILEEPELPGWLKGALFNGLYFVADGGTLWLDHTAEKKTARKEGPEGEDMGYFGYLEGHEYRMYNTYDVHFYASVALLTNWPRIELEIQREMGRALGIEDRDQRQFVMDGRSGTRKVPGAIPHDIGEPSGAPFERVNSYNIHNTSEWKDLNSKFVLQVYRDYKITGDSEFLVTVFPSLLRAIEYMFTFDEDGDGVIDNRGSADQTYDAWSVRGCSAYSGGLWLAALQSAICASDAISVSDPACVRIASDALRVRATEAKAVFEQWLARGKRAYTEKLFNGAYFDYDSSKSTHSNSIMADQCAGSWYLQQSGLEPVVSERDIASALRTVYENNVKRYAGGRMGAVNGMRPNGGGVDRASMQSEEVWLGTTFAVAATMIQNGMLAEGFETAHGLVDYLYNRAGYAFQLPEAVGINHTYRSLSYMRPLSVWAILSAWRARKEIDSKVE